MFTGKIIGIAIAIMVTLAGAAGYLIMTMRADDARYQAERAADIAAMREAAKRPAFMPESPGTAGR